MKKGFTLIEMIGVVTILAVLMMIASIPVTKTLRDFNKKAYQMEIDNIEKAAKLWGNEHPAELQRKINNNENLYLYELQNEGYLESKIINPKTNKKFNNQLVIKITKMSEKRYVYEVQEDSIQ